MTTSILTSIGSLLSGTVKEEFGKLFQPASLVAAALFVTLNLILINPFLVEQRVYFALVLQSMGDVAQLALLTLLILALGYLISSLGPAVLALVTGATVRDNRLVQATFARWEKERFQALQDDLKVKDESLQARALHRLAFEFPREVQRIAPNRLGNAIDSAASYTWEQHGAALDTLWPVMETVLKEKNPEMLARIQQNRTSLTFFASLIVLLIVTLLEVLLLRLFLGRPGAVATIVIGALLLLAAYLFYNAAVRTALGWSQDVRAAFDLYTSQVETNLALRPLASFELEQKQKRKDRLQGVSWWLAHGAIKFPDGTPLKEPARDPDWYHAKPEAAPALTLVTAPGLKTQSRRHVVEEWKQHRVSKHEYRLPGRIVDYLLAVSNEQSGQGAHAVQGSFLIAQDSGLPTLPGTVDGTLAGTGAGSAGLAPGAIQSQRLPGIPEALLWDLGEIPPQASRLLHYSVAYDPRVRISPPARISELDVSPTTPGSRQVKVTLTCNDCPQGSLVVTVQVANKEQLSAKSEYSIENGDCGELDISYDPATQEGSWIIADVSAGATVRTMFWLEPL